MPTFMSNCKPVIEWCITSKQTFTIAVIYSRNITGTLIMIITPGPTTHSRNNVLKTYIILAADFREYTASIYKFFTAGTGNNSKFEHRYSQQY